MDSRICFGFAPATALRVLGHRGLIGRNSRPALPTIARRRLRVVNNAEPVSAPVATPTTLTSAANTDQVRVRFAPSPTGSLHVGGARTALYNWLHARQNGGKFIIRVEDTDLKRSTRESELTVLENLKWLQLHWDEGPDYDGANGEGVVGPYRQSERKDIYLRYAQQLIASGAAYPCFCTEEEIQADRDAAKLEGRPYLPDEIWRDADPQVVADKLAAGDAHTIRFKVPRKSRVVIDDHVRGKVAWDCEATVGDFILLRSDGMPVYNFCVAIDDGLMGVTTVIRAEEHLTNTLKQVLVLNALNVTPPRYAHCSLILGADKQKLSKRDGAASVGDFRDLGYLPHAMVNYLATLGWNDGTEQEIYTVDQLIEAFDINRITKSAAMFDLAKLKHVNGIHLRAMDSAQLAPMLAGVWAKTGVFKGEIPEVISLAATEIVKGSLDLLNDAEEEVRNILSYQLSTTIEKDASAAELVRGEEDDEEVNGFVSVGTAILAAYDNGTLPTGQGNEEEHKSAWKKWVKATGKQLGRKGKKLYHPLRLALTGKMSGPDVGAILHLLHITENAGASEILVPLSARIEMLRSEVEKRA